MNFANSKMSSEFIFLLSVKSCRLLNVLKIQNAFRMIKSCKWFCKKQNYEFWIDFFTVCKIPKFIESLSFCILKIRWFYYGFCTLNMSMPPNFESLHNSIFGRPGREKPSRHIRVTRCTSINYIFYTLENQNRLHTFALAAGDLRLKFLWFVMAHI